MPSYLDTQQPAPQFIPTEPSSPSYFAHGVKAFGLIAQPSKQSTSTANDSFDESSTHSTELSDVSEAQPELNGSMDGLPHGIHDTQVDGVALNGKDASKKQLPNGIPGLTVLPDRSTHQRPPSTNGPDTTLTSPNNEKVLPPLGASADGPIHQVPFEMPVQTVDNRDVRTVDASTPPGTTTHSHLSLPQPHKTNNSPLHSSTAQSTPNPDLRNAHAPHRFSSPPVYHPDAASTSSSSRLEPPIGAALKHRHTLEVPKATPSRTSRDGSIDAAISSGRFSPTNNGPGARRTSLSLIRRNTRSLPPNEVIPDEDALRWAEAYRQKRANKRRKAEWEDDDRVLVGTKVDENHANWVTAYNMLTGIRVSVSRTNAKLDRPLTDADFQAKQKSTFDM